MTFYLATSKKRNIQRGKPTETKSLTGNRKKWRGKKSGYKRQIC